MFSRRAPTRLAVLALVCFLFYLGWNAYWLCRGALPPSILLGVFGIPAPTTGMTRALLALGRGDWWLSARWNPLAVPLLGLYLASLGVVLWRGLRRQRLVLPVWMAWGWGILLLGGWIVKLVAGPAWW